MKRIALTLLFALVAPPLAAQETRPLSEDAAASIVAFYNDAGTTRVRGPTRIAAGAVFDGAIASLGGPLIVAGTVRGDVAVINGDLRLLPGGRIEGEATVVGGRFEGMPEGVAGGRTVYHEPLRFRTEDDRLVADRPERPAAGRTTWFGRADFVATVDGSYNRVEGLPVAMGPRVQLGLSNPTVVDARLIFRTRSGLRLDHKELGHDVSIEQYLGGHRGLVLGAGMHGVIDPIEDAGLSDTENSFATFVLHQDYRDHYKRDGWSAYLRLVGTTRPYVASIEYRDETHASIRPGTPWSLLRNDRPWRAQPQVAGGQLRALRGTFRWDSRNDPRDPAAGWLVEVEVEQGLGGTLSYDAVEVADPGSPTLAPRAVDSEFTSISVDARRYLRLGPRSRLALRGKSAGAPDRGALPPQRQHVLGAEGGLPGYPHLRFDCGARAVEPEPDGFYPYYGCDRVLLFQAEYRYALLTDPQLGRRLGVDFDLFATPELVLFANAGRAWIEARARDGRGDLGPRTIQPDIGAGLRLGPIGVYIATPLTGAGSGPNLFIRLGPRL